MCVACFTGLDLIPAMYVWLCVCIVMVLQCIHGRMQNAPASLGCGGVILCTCDDWAQTFRKIFLRYRKYRKSQQTAI